MDMIEKVARALCKLYLHGDDSRFWGPSAHPINNKAMTIRLEREWPTFSREAEVAIEAIEQ